MDTFEGEAEGDLSFQNGDVIAITERIDGDWLIGTCKGQSGMFPQVFVNVVVDLAVGVVTSGVKEETTSANEVIALFDFDGQSEEELTFKVKQLMHNSTM